MKKNISGRELKILLGIVIIFELLLVFFFTDIKAPVKPNTVTSKNNIKMIMAGDVLIHGAVYKDAYESKNYNFDKMFESIVPLVKGYDLAFYNQESIIGGESLGLSTYPRFNSPEAIGDSMTKLGFNLVSLANNHTLDRGEAAIKNSINYWQTKDVVTAGSYLSKESRNNIPIQEINGIKYAFLAYTTTTNGLKAPTNKEYLVNVYSEEQALKDLKQVKDKCDLVIVSMHWGDEYSLEYNAKQKSIATFLSNNGANLIIGHHPHVLEPIEYINDTLVIYSLGNFISGQEGTDKLVGALVSLEINKTNNKITFDNLLVRLTYTYYNSKYQNFKVLPFDELNETTLKNYEKHYLKYSSIFKDIEVASLKE